jgi:predicted transcriptional regulator of viral defense system
MTQGEARTPRGQKLQQLLELASTQGGYFTATQGRGLGYSARSLVYQVEAGHIERVSRGFYRVVGLPAAPHGDIIAAWLRFSSRRAVVSHETALALYDLAPTRSNEIHLTVPRERRPRAPQSLKTVRLHTATVPLRRENLTTRFGLVLTAPARTIVDVAAIGADPSVVLEATGRALATGLLSREELRTAVKDSSARVRLLIDRAIDEARPRA